MYSTFKKTICLLLMSTILFVSCAAHVPKVMEPTNSDVKSEWLAYYKDQFKAHGKKVQPPQVETDSVQFLAYKEAKSSWQSRQNVGMIISTVALVISVGAFLGTMSEL